MRHPETQSPGVLDSGLPGEEDGSVRWDCANKGVTQTSNKQEKIAIRPPPRAFIG